jgi:hypothetical protein
VEITSMHDKREKAQRDIEIMKSKIIDELEANDSEYEALKAELSIDAVAGQADQRKDAQAEADLAANLGSLTQEEEELIISSINKAYWAIAKKKMDIQKQADKIHELQDDFKYLSEQTGVSDVETLIPLLLNSEEENFRLFDATNEFNKELETLEVEKGKLRTKNAKFARILSDQNDGKLKMKTDLQDQIERAKNQASRCDSRYGVDLETLKKISPSILSIFNRVGCGDEGLTNTLLAEGITDRNVDEYMAVIEQRIEEIVQLHNSTQKKGLSQFGGSAVDPTRPPTPIFDHLGKRMAALRAPMLPSHTDFEDTGGDGEDDGDEPLEPMHVSKLHDLVARDTRAARLGGGGKSKLNIGYKGRGASNASLRGKNGARSSSKGLRSSNTALRRSNTRSKTLLRSAGDHE